MIQNFPVTKRRRSVGNRSSSDLVLWNLPSLTILVGKYFIIPSVSKRAVTLFSPVNSSGSLPRPPPSSQARVWSYPPTSPPSATASMNRSSLHGGPARGSQNPKSSQDARSSQHARSSFAVQPAINAGTFTYKKKAVKIVSAASSVPVAARPQALPSQLTAMPAEAAASLPTPDPSPAPDPAGSRFAAKE